MSCSCSPVSARANWRAASVLLAAFLFAPPALFSHGPIAPMEVEFVPGRVLVMAREGVELTDGSGMLIPHSPAMATLLSSAGALEAEALLPHYRPEALAALEERAASGLRAPEDKVRQKMTRLGRWTMIPVDKHVDVLALVKQLEALPEVEAAEPDYLMRLVDGEQDDFSIGWDEPFSDYLLPQFLPDDPDFGLQWGLDYIDAPEAWDLTMGDPSQVIAVIDTGVDLDHPDLATKIWSNLDEAPGDFNSDGCPGICGTDEDGDGLIDEDGQGRQPGDPGYDPSYADDDDENGFIDDFLGWDWISNGEGFEDNDPQDDNGHGTHCAGIAAATTDNGIGGAGTCPGCRVMPLKAFQSSGAGAFSDIAKAVDYAWRNGATVLSMSFSSPADSSLVRDALSLAFSSATLVAAAGNDGLSRLTPTCSLTVRPYYPAHYSFVLGIEAGDGVGDLVSFSNCQYELRNPGEAIYSTVLDDDYATWSGTSMAAPFVAGTAALLQSFHAGNPAWTPDLVFGQLIQTSGNAFDALTLVPEPDLRFISHEIVDDACGICDGDGVADSGETVEIVVTIRNFWGSATGVDGTLSTADALATVVDGSATWGSVGPAAFDDNSDNPFEVDIDPATGNNRDIVFDLVVDATNGGTGINTQIVLTIQRGVEKGGVLAASETWTSDNLYLVTSNLLIMPGVTLTIEPGTRIQIDPATSITVRGELISRGTPAERIVLTGNPDSWGGLLFTEESVPTVLDGSGDYLSGSALEYCIFEDSGGLPNSGIIELREDVYVARNIFVDAYNADKIMVLDSSPPCTAPVERNLVNRNSTHADGIWFRACAPTFRYNSVVANHTQGALSANTWPVDIAQNNIFGDDSYDFRLTTSQDLDVTDNYWGTTDPVSIAEQIWDFFESPSVGVALWDPPLAVPAPEAPPVVADIVLAPISPVGAERVTFTVSFSKPMDISAYPEVFFGPAEPFTSHPVDLNPTWLDPLTFQVEADVTIFTGDGLQTITVWNAEDPEGFPIPTGDHRFGFEIVTAGTSARRIFATGSAGRVDLDWEPSDLPDVAGYNIYRGDQTGGPYDTQLNSAIVVDSGYIDFTADPGVEYFYIFRVITTDLLEGPDSDEASGTALDTVAPIITHSPVTSAPAGLPLTILADITDNISVTAANLFHRPSTGGAYTELSMINATGDQYTENIPVESMVPPGVEYYLEASDGVNATQHGTPAAPHTVTVQNVPVILSVDPTSGSFLGGEMVTILGSNFVNPPTVRFGGTVSPAVTFVSATELESTTPAHYPVLVDVEVENPDTSTGRSTNAFTFMGATTTLNLPAAATGDRLTTVQIPVSTPSVEGLVSALLTVQFDPAVLTATGASPGSLTPGFVMAVNTSVPGEISVSMADTAPVSGAGSIVLLEFQVVGPPAAATALTFSGVELNDDAIPTNLVDGGFTVNNAFDITGAVSYYQGALPVADTQLDITGSGSFSASTDVSGNYAFIGLPSGNYTLTPTKSDGHSPSVISPFDASLVLQHSIGLITLTGHAATAANVNKAGGISPLDASFILQYAATLIGLPFPGSPTIWDFDPALYNYPVLDLDQPGQDFTGILIGDPSGNWAPLVAAAGPAGQGGDGVSSAQPDVAATLSFGTHQADSGASLTIPLVAENMDGVLAVLATLRFDPLVLSLTDVSTTDFSSNFAMEINTSVPGRIVVAMAAAEALVGSGDLLTLDFDVVGNDGTVSVLDIESAELNEGAIEALLVDGLFQTPGIFTDGFESGDTGEWSTVVP